MNSTSEHSGFDFDSIADNRYLDDLRHDPGSPSFIFFDDRYDKDFRDELDRAKEFEEFMARRRDYDDDNPPDDDPHAYRLAQYARVYNPVSKRYDEVETEPKAISFAEHGAHRSFARWYIGWYRNNSLQKGDVAREALRKALNLPRPAEAHFLTPAEEDAWEWLYVRMGTYPVLRRALKRTKLLSFVSHAPTHTVFLNPDGRRIETPGRSPIQAKIAFLQRHRPQNFDFEFEGLRVKGADEETAAKALRSHLGPKAAAKFVREALTVQFPKHPLDESQVMVEKVIKEDGTSYYFVAKRVPSNERASSYYDPDPSFREVRTRDGWEKQYQWTSGLLRRVPPSGVIDGHRLTVREIEQAMLAGASFADSQADVEAHYLGDNALPDHRERGLDDRKIRVAGSLSHDEEYLYEALRAVGLDEIAERVLEEPENAHMLGNLLLRNGRISPELEMLMRYIKDQDDAGRVDWPKTKAARSRYLKSLGLPVSALSKEQNATYRDLVVYLPEQDQAEPMHDTILALVFADEADKPWLDRLLEKIKARRILSHKLSMERQKSQD